MFRGGLLHFTTLQCDSSLQVAQVVAQVTIISGSTPGRSNTAFLRMHSSAPVSIHQCTHLHQCALIYISALIYTRALCIRVPSVHPYSPVCTHLHQYTTSALIYTSVYQSVPVYHAPVHSSAPMHHPDSFFCAGNGATAHYASFRICHTLFTL